MKRLALILWFLLPALVWGQIELPTSADANTVVKARCLTVCPKDGRIRYRWSAPTLSLVESETGKLAYITGVSGEHIVTCTVATATADTLDLEDFSAIIVFEGDAPVPPKPVPTPVTLRSLVDDEQAAQLSEFYRDFSKAVESTPPASVKQFLTVHDTMFALLGIDNPQLDAALAKRLNGMELEGLSGELLKLAGEFGDGPGPTPPPVEQGARRVVILHETADDTPELGSLWVKLRTGNADKYLTDNKHELLILDDDLEGTYPNLLRDKQELPAVFILDPHTNAILFQATLEPGTTADNIIERIRETGG